MSKTLLAGGELLFYGDVGDPYGWGDGFTPTDVANALAEHGPGDLTVRINSGGGIAQDGMAIYSLLKTHDGKVTVMVDGMAASAASLIAMAGAERQMRQGAMMMIHDPAAITLGNEATHQKAVERLGKISDNYAGVYAKASGKKNAEARNLMKAETWLTADEAVAHGFATGVLDEPADQMSAFDYRIYARAPASLPVRKSPESKGAFMTKPNAAGGGAGDDIGVKEKPWAGKFFMAAQSSGLDIVALNTIVATADTFEVAKDALIDKMAEGNKTKPGVGASDMNFGNPDFLEKSIEDALYSRMTVKSPEGAAREWAGRTLLDMGAALMQARGRRVSWASRERLAGQILMDSGGQHSTSDFPTLLTSSGQRVLLDAYKAAECPLKLFAKPRPASDFRTLTSVRLSEAPSLDLVDQGGAVTYGSRSEEKEAFSVKTFARIFGITRQAIVNDDLSAFADTGTAWGKAAAETEALQIVALFTANAGNGVSLDDGNAIYTTVRGNKAVAGAAISVTTLGAGRQALRSMKGLDGKTPIGAAAKHLVVGPAKETEAEQALTALFAAQQQNANPFAGKLTLHVEPRFTGNAWRLFADPTDLPTLVIAYLNGSNGPIVETRPGWTTLGVEFRAILDFGCGITDWRGTYLNPGD